MRIVYPRGCGMDVHQQGVTAGLHRIDQEENSPAQNAGSER